MFNTKQLFLNSFFYFALLFLFESCQKAENSTTPTVTTVPFPPTDLTATVVSTTQVNLSWVDKSTNEVGFKIERKTSATQYTAVTTLGADITLHNDNGLSPKTSYTYRVYSYNSVGASPTYSNEVTVTTIGLPSLTTTAVSNLTAVDGSSGGNITNDGGGAVTARGVVWSTSQNPTIALSTKTNDGSGTGTFSSNITGLSATTKYFIRAYATNAAGTAYGNEVSFTTNTIDLTSNLAAYYPFNGNANDESANSVKLNGAVNGPTLTTDRFNKVNSAYLFSNNNISVLHNTRLNASNSFSVSLWFYSTNDVVGDLIMKGLGDGYAYTWYLRHHSTTFNDPNIKFNYTPAPAVGRQVGASTPQINTWTHIVGVIDGSTLRIYKNGVFTNSISNIDLSNASLNQSTMQIGITQYGYYGKIDDIRIYNRTLNQDEITYLSKN